MIAKAAAEVAERVGAKYLVAFTQSGDSARRLSRLRGPIPILAFTPEAAVRSQLALSWGVETFKHPPGRAHRRDGAPGRRAAAARSAGSSEGDLVVIIAGSPPGIPGSTNALRIHRMGDAINEVAPAYRRAADPSHGPAHRVQDCRTVETGRTASTRSTPRCADLPPSPSTRSRAQRRARDVGGHVENCQRG